MAVAIDNHVALARPVEPPDIWRLTFRDTGAATDVLNRLFENDKVVWENFTWTVWRIEGRTLTVMK